MRTIWKLITLGAVLAGLTGCGINSNPGSGEKVGQVIKLNHQGVFNTTWEAELIRGGLNGGSGGFGVQPFDFTIDSDDLAGKVKDFMENQTEVKIKYHASFFYNLFGSDSNGFYLVSIEPLKQ